MLFTIQNTILFGSQNIENTYLIKKSNYTKEILQRIAEEYDFEVDTMEVMKEYVHLFLSAPPRYSPHRIVQIMKNISSREVFRRFPHLKEILWNMELWSDGYFVRTVGGRVTAKVIERYIKYQHEEEQLDFGFSL